MMMKMEFEGIKLIYDYSFMAVFACADKEIYSHKSMVH